MTIMQWVIVLVSAYVITVVVMFLLLREWCGGRYVPAVRRWASALPMALPVMWLAAAGQLAYLGRFPAISALALLIGGATLVRGLRILYKEGIRGGR